MDWKRFGRNLLFASSILLIVVGITRADLSVSTRVEEYVTFVLTTDFDYEGWLAANGHDGFLQRIAGWGDALMGIGERAGGTSAAPVTTEGVR